jgi:hypothetical protein
MPDRIEFIPIEWYDRVHSSSSSLSRSLNSVTLPTIQALRGIANEAVFDVLLYMTPSFCGAVLVRIQLYVLDDDLSKNWTSNHFLTESET